MPPSFTAHVGIDTLVHGIEAYVSKKAFGMTDTLALSCIGLTLAICRLPTATEEPGSSRSNGPRGLPGRDGLYQ